MTATEIRNVTGITDDALLNAACDAERKENLAKSIEVNGDIELTDDFSIRKNEFGSITIISNENEA